MGSLKNVIIHTSDSPHGNAVWIDRMHRKRGWKSIGYHCVITNGIPDRHNYDRQLYFPWTDGNVEWGRPFDDDKVIMSREQGAHAYGHNRNSIGICLIGKDGVYSHQQMLTLQHLCRQFRQMWKLSPDAFIGHYEVDKQGETCPDLNMDDVRAWLFGGRSLEAVRGGPDHAHYVNADITLREVVWDS